MARRRAHSEEHENAERWLLTYADMITLLMAFFIMLYSMSQLDLKKFDAMTGSVQAQLGGTGVLKASMNVTAGPEQRSGPPGISPSPGGGTAGVKQALTEKLRPLVSGVEVSEGGGQVRVTLPATQLYFPAGSAEPTPMMVQVLRRMSETLRHKPHGVQVLGHTCDLPVRNAQYQSNWELSADRARNVAFRLMRSGAVRPEHCSYMGLAATQPACPNDTEAHRARNRRVEIIISPLGGGDDAPGDEATDPAAPTPKPNAGKRRGATGPVDIRPHLERKD